MTTEAQPQTQQEQPDDFSVGRVLGRLEANQQAMLQILERHGATLERHDANIVELDKKVSSLEANQQAMLQILERHDAILERHGANIAELGEKLTSLGANQLAMLQRMDRQDGSMGRLEAKIDSNQRWTIGLLLLTLITVLGAMAAGFWAVLAALAN